MMEQKVKEIFNRDEVLQDKYEIKIDRSRYVPSGKIGVSVLIKCSILSIIIYKEQLDKLIELFKGEGYELVGIFIDEGEVSIDFVDVLGRED